MREIGGAWKRIANDGDLTEVEEECECGSHLLEIDGVHFKCAACCGRKGYVPVMIDG